MKKSIYLKRRQVKVLCSLVLALLSYLSCYSQYNETIRTGRPGQGSEPYSVGKSVFQMQGGFDFGGYQDENSESNNQNLFPNILLRYGIGKSWDLNIEGGFRNDKYTFTDTVLSQSGLSFLTVGARINLYQGKGLLPAIGMQVSAKLPYVSEPYTSEEVIPVVKLIANAKLNDEFAYLVNVGVEYENNSKSATGFYVLNLGYSISSKWAIFIENYGSINSGLFEDRWDGGVAWLVNNNLQLDVYGGIGLNNHVRDYFTSIGFSWRIYKTKNQL